MKTNIKEINDFIENQNNEVARLREKASTWHENYRDEASKAQKCKQAYIELEKEVARICEQNLALRQIVTDLSGVARGALFHCPYPARSDGEKIVARLYGELDALSPAPEEPNSPPK